MSCKNAKFLSLFVGFLFLTVVAVVAVVDNRCYCSLSSVLLLLLLLLSDVVIGKGCWCYCKMLLIQLLFLSYNCHCCCCYCCWCCRCCCIYYQVMLLLSMLLPSVVSAAVLSSVLRILPSIGLVASGVVVMHCTVLSSIVGVVVTAVTKPCWYHLLTSAAVIDVAFTNCCCWINFCGFFVECLIPSFTVVMVAVKCCYNFAKYCWCHCCCCYYTILILHVTKCCYWSSFGGWF